MNHSGTSRLNTTGSTYNIDITTMSLTMNVPLKKLVKLLQDKDDETLRAAAATVIGELGAKDTEANAELLTRLDDADQNVRLAAIKATGQLKIEKALPKLLDKVAHGGPQASVAAEAAAKLGVKGVRGLQDMMHKVAPGLKRYIAAALTTSGSHGADAVGVSVLFDKDPMIGRAAADAIIGQIPAMPPDRKRTLVEELIVASKDKRKPIPVIAELPVLRILAAINDPKSAELLWSWTGPPHSHEVRAAALSSVGGWVKSPSKEQWKRLFLCALDQDFRVAAPALMILQRLPVEKNAGDWLPLFDAPDVAARRLAMEKLGDRDTAEVAKGLMGQFHHPDRNVSESARLHLQNSKTGRKAMLSALLVAETPEAAWSLVRVLKEVSEEIPPASVKEIIAQTTEHVAAHSTLADPFLFFSRELSSLQLQEALLEKAVVLRKKKKYIEALAFLKVLARDPGIGFAVRLELALCGLKQSPKDVDPHARNDDPCLRNFDTLMNQDFDLLEKELAKAKFLDAEDLYYIAFHFSEQVGRQRQFGIDMLKQVAKTNKAEAGKAAKNKLKNVGA